MRSSVPTTVAAPHISTSSNSSSNSSATDRRRADLEGQLFIFKLIVLVHPPLWALPVRDSGLPFRCCWHISGPFKASSGFSKPAPPLGSS